MTVLQQSVVSRRHFIAHPFFVVAWEQCHYYRCPPISGHPSDPGLVGLAAGNLDYFSPKNIRLHIPECQADG